MNAKRNGYIRCHSKNHWSDLDQILERWCEFNEKFSTAFKQDGNDVTYWHCENANNSAFVTAANHADNFIALAEVSAQRNSNKTGLGKIDAYIAFLDENKNEEWGMFYESKVCWSNRRTLPLKADEFQKISSKLKLARKDLIQIKGEDCHAIAGCFYVPSFQTPFAPLGKEMEETANAILADLSASSVAWESVRSSVYE